MSDPKLTLNDDQFNRMLGVVRNTLTSRMEWLRRKLQPDPRRDVYEECGLPKSITAEQYRDFWKRDPIAGRVIDFMPSECWQIKPYIYESEDDEPTEFEKSWDAVGENLQSIPSLKMKSFYKKEKYNPIWDYFRRVDTMAGVGTYGVMLLGFDDVKVEETATGFSPGSLSEPVKPKKGMKLNYIRVFPEYLAEIATYDSNPASPRYGMPLTYSITFNDPNDSISGIGIVNTIQNVHWTRVIHVAEDLTSNEVHGTPRCESVWNNIQNLFKIAAADPEGYWYSCFNILSAETHPQLGGDEVDVDKTAMRNMFENLMHGLQRWVVMEGMSLKSVAPSVVDPTPHIDTQINLICIRKGWPIRIFKGSERGELASSMDEGEHKARVQQRRDGFCTSAIVIPTVDRLIWAGVIPEPSEEGYCIEWPDSTIQTEESKANVALVKAQTLSQYISSGSDQLIPPAKFLTDIMNMDEEKAEQIIEEAAQHVEEKQATEIEQTQTKIEEGVMVDPQAKAGKPGENGQPFGGKK